MPEPLSGRATLLLVWLVSHQAQQLPAPEVWHMTPGRQIYYQTATPSVDDSTRAARTVSRVSWETQMALFMPNKNIQSNSCLPNMPAAIKPEFRSQVPLNKPVDPLAFIPFSG